MKVIETRCVEIVLTREERDTLRAAADIVGEIYEEMRSAHVSEFRGNETDWGCYYFDDAADMLRDWANADVLKAEE